MTRPGPLDGDAGERAIVGCVGKAGSGKSTQLRAYAARCRRALILDLERNWTLQPGDVVIEGWRPLWEALVRTGARHRSTPFRYVYREHSNTLMLHAAVEIGFAFQHFTLIADEIAWVCRAQYLPEPLERFVQMGRRYWLNLLYTTREPQEIHNRLLGQATLMHFFRMDPGLGLDRVKKYYPGIWQDLPTLPPHHVRTYGDEASPALFGAEGLDKPTRKIPSSRHSRTRRSKRS